MNINERKKYITKFRVALQKTRSIFFEQAENDGLSRKNAEILGARLMPWCFGEKCLLTHLDKMEANPSDQDIANLNYIMTKTPALSVSGIYAGLKILDPTKIFTTDTMEEAVGNSQ